MGVGVLEGSASHPSFASSQPCASAAHAYAPNFVFGGGLADFALLIISLIHLNCFGRRLAAAQP